MEAKVESTSDGVLGRVRPPVALDMYCDREPGHATSRLTLGETRVDRLTFPPLAHTLSLRM